VKLTPQCAHIPAKTCVFKSRLKRSESDSTSGSQQRSNSGYGGGYKSFYTAIYAPGGRIEDVTCLNTDGNQVFCTTGHSAKHLHALADRSFATRRNCCVMCNKRKADAVRMIAVRSRADNV